MFSTFQKKDDSSGSKSKGGHTIEEETPPRGELLSATEPAPPQKTSVNACRFPEPADKTAEETENCEDDADVLELSPSETLCISGKSLELRRESSPNQFKIVFNDFTFVQFVRCTKELSLFLSMPTKQQYQVMTSFLNRAKENCLTKKDFEAHSRRLDNAIKFACSQFVETEEEEKFFLEKFLLLNMPLLYTNYELGFMIEHHIHTASP